jgi:hypothetical protein
MKAHLVQYTYTETFCSPYTSEWETRTKVLIATMDESLAEEARDKYNTINGYQAWDSNAAKVVSYELVSRPA